MEPSEREFICPACGAHMLAPDCDGGEPVTVTCPQCQELLTLSPDPVDIEVTDNREDELDGARIERFAKMKRSLYRSRSHAVIGAVVCTVAAAQFGVTTARQIAAQSIAPAIIYGLGMLLFAGAAVLVARRAMQLHREAKNHRN